MTPEQRAELRKAAEEATEYGADRYRVEKTGHGFWPYCVKAGSGTRELFNGHQKSCTKVARELATAFADGKFFANPATILQLLDYVESLERDAARYRWLRENWTTMRSAYYDGKLRLMPNQGKLADFCEDEVDSAIDAAIGESK